MCSVLVFISFLLFILLRKPKKKKKEEEGKRRSIGFCFLPISKHLTTILQIYEQRYLVGYFHKEAINEVIKEKNGSILNIRKKKKIDTT